MNSTIIAVLLGYSLISLIFGWVAHRRSAPTSEDYFVANRSVTWFHLGLTMFATWFSTFAFLGAPGFALAQGPRWLATMGVFGIGSPFLMWFIGRKLWLAGKRHGYITPADLLADFYKNQTIRYIVAIICILSLVPYCLIQLVGIGKVIASTTDGYVPYGLAVILTGVVTAFYTFVGGIRAIVWTDIIQGILFLLLVMIGVGTVIYANGGISAGYAAALQSYPDRFIFSPDDFGSVITMMTVWSFGFVLFPHLWQRAYMADSAKTLSKAIILQTSMAFLLVVLVNLMGTLGIGLITGLTDTDQYVPTLFAQYFPYALPLLALATFAAGMSTIDSQLLTASSVFVRDIIPGLKKGPAPSLKQEKVLGRWFVLALIAALTGLALLPEAQGPIIKLATKGAGLSLLLLIPLLGPLTSEESSATAANLGLISALALFTLLELKIITFSIPLNLGAPIVSLLFGLIISTTISRLSCRKGSPCHA